MSSDCPICSDVLIHSEELYSLPCESCDYNFCTKCAEEFIRASKDGYQEASDGSNQVKIRVACPQCRSKYPMDIADILLLRKAHSLSLAIFTLEGVAQTDSELSATQLSYKSDFYSASKKKNVESAHGVYVKVSNPDESKTKQLHEAVPVCQRLFPGADEQEKNGIQDDKKEPEWGHETIVDSTLFLGLEDCMGTAEQAFVTRLLTCGDKEKLAQAAMILHGILQLSITARPLSRLAPSLSLAQQQALEIRKEQIKKSFPLPNHMPGYVVIAAFAKKKAYIVLADTEWDGSIVPPKASARIFNNVYGDYTLPSEPRKCVMIQSVRGPAGRVGLRKADIVSHCNDMEWTGTAQQLMEYIWETNDRHPGQEINLTVNANQETAFFLHLRNKLLVKSRLEVF
jgi:hypothetical protein